jgi:hypothetical protein
MLRAPRGLASWDQRATWSTIDPGADERSEIARRGDRCRPRGLPANYQSCLTRMIEPIGEHRPYFVERFAAADASWTAKFVVIAANAWTADQGSWLELALSEPTTYTFVVRHEPHDADTAPGVTPAGPTMAT